MVYKMLQKVVPRFIVTGQYSRCMSICAKAIKYSKHGEPKDVLELMEHEIKKPCNKEVLVKMLAAPINPADINTIQGKYPVKPKFPAVGGNEGVGEVIEVGDNVKNLTVGQRVVPAVTGVGTWSSHILFEEEQLLPISNKIGLAAAATLTVNPCTAYRMLKDFVSLNPGDCIIQNGANSAVGQSVHQLCAAWGLKSIGIVRNRPNIDELKTFLKKLGATEILTEEELRTTKLFTSGNIPKPLLALNCVGGKSATEISRHLANKGQIITYGGMSREPVAVSTASLIFKDYAYRGFWMTRWVKEHGTSNERKQMIKDLCTLMERCQLMAPVHEMVPMAKFKEATTAALNFKGFTGKKFIFDMTK